MRLLLAAALLAAALAGCVGSPSGTIEVSVVATTTFGQELLFERTALVPAGATALEALQAVAGVETAYGGGFVNAIDGVRSGYTGGGGAQLDWFYYVNGLLANAGAGTFVVHDGDRVHWDFHDWSRSLAIPAFAGDFPEPFLHGVGGQRRPVLIGAGKAMEQGAARLGNALDSGGSVTVEVVPIVVLASDPRTAAGGHHLVLIGTVDEPLLRELGAQHEKLGFFARWGSGALEILDARGEVVRRSAGALIAMTQNPWFGGGTGAMESAVLMIVGAEPETAVRATSLLAETPQAIARLHSALVEEEEVIPLP